MPGWQRRWPRVIPTGKSVRPITSAGRDPRRRARNSKTHNSQHHRDAAPEQHPSVVRQECRAYVCRWPLPACGDCDGPPRVHESGGIRCSRMCGSRRPHKSRDWDCRARSSSRGAGRNTVAISVDDVESLSSMCVKKMQLVRTVRNGLQFWLGVGTRDQPAGEDQGQQEETGRISWRPGQDKKLLKWAGTTSPASSLYQVKAHSWRNMMQL
jgi:hypothetical protein